MSGRSAPRVLRVLAAPAACLLSGAGDVVAAVEPFSQSNDAAPGRASAALAIGVEPVAGGSRERPDDPLGAAGPGGSSRTESDGGTISL